MKILMLLLLFNLSSCISAQNNNSSDTGKQSEATQNQEIVDVNLCDLVQYPEKFEKKIIRIKAIYFYGFEWSTLYSTKCEIKKRIWVDSTDAKCKNTDKLDEMDHAGMGGRTVGIVAVGQFTGEKERYGNMNSYRYLFKIDCFEKAEMLDRENLLPDTPKLKKKMENFENSN